MVGPGDGGKRSHRIRPPALTPRRTRRDVRAPRVNTVIAQAGGVALGICPGQGANHGDTTGSVIPPAATRRRRTPVIRRRTSAAADGRRARPEPRRRGRHRRTDVEPSRRHDDDDGRSPPSNPPRRTPARTCTPGRITHHASGPGGHRGAGRRRGMRAVLLGMAAACGLATTLLKHGDRCVLPGRCFGVRVLASTARARMRFRLYDCRRGKLHEHERARTRGRTRSCGNEGKRGAAIGTDGKTKLVWIETPANPTWDVTCDVCDRAHTFGASVCVDNTVLTPRAARRSASARTLSCTRRRNISTATATSSPDGGRRRGRRAVGSGQVGEGDERRDPRLVRGVATAARDAHAARKGAAVRVGVISRRDSPRMNVSVCLYQGLASHPGRRRDGASTDGVSFGGMMSIRVKGGADAAKVCAGCVRFGSRLRRSTAGWSP